MNNYTVENLFSSIEQTLNQLEENGVSRSTAFARIFPDQQNKVDNWDSLSPVLKKVVELRIRKGQDYNSGPTLDDYFPFGHYSYTQMIHLKVTRIHSLLAKKQTPNFDSLLDTLEDLINYTTFYAEAISTGKLSNKS